MSGASLRISRVIQVLKQLRSKPASQVSSITKADDSFVSDMDEQKARWTEYLEQLYKADPKDAAARVRRAKTAGVCNISEELLKGESEADSWVACRTV